MTKLEAEVRRRERRVGGRPQLAAVFQIGARRGCVASKGVLAEGAALHLAESRQPEPLAEPPVHLVPHADRVDESPVEIEDDEVAVIEGVHGRVRWCPSRAAAKPTARLAAT